MVLYVAQRLWPSASEANASRLAVIMWWIRLGSWINVGCVGAKATHAGRSLVPLPLPGELPQKLYIGRIAYQTLDSNQPKFELQWLLNTSVDWASYLNALSCSFSVEHQPSSESHYKDFMGWNVWSTWHRVKP